MKKLIIRLSLFCPLLFFIILFNCVVDPARLFQTKDYERKMADALISGDYVTTLENTNYDDRTLQKFMIQSLKNKKDIGVIGSSRVMQISSEMFPGKTLLNNGVSAAFLEDYISLYEIYRERQVLPSIIIIGVDPWIFDKNNGSVQWQQFGQYYLKFISSSSRNLFDLKVRPQDYISYQIQQLASFSYFQAGIQFLWSKHSRLFSKKQWFSLTRQKYNEKETILADGSRTWRKDHREAPLEEVRKKIRDDIATEDSINFFRFVELDKGLKLNFIKLIQLMRGEGVEIILYLPPYHPLAYDFYIHSNKFKVIEDVENFLRNVSEIYGLTLVGSYNPYQLFIPESSFEDSIHLRDDTELKRIFSNVIELKK